jgi:VanZ family protein
LPLTVLLVVIAGLSDEFHQAFVPLRNSDAWDLVADFCGGTVSSTWFFYKYQMSQLKKSAVNYIL